RGKQRPYVGKEPAIGSGIAPGRPSDRGLVDLDDLIDILQPFYALIFQWRHLRSIGMFAQDRIQCLIDQRRLAAATDARDHNELAQREFDIHVLEVVSPGALYFQKLSIALSPLLRYLDLLMTVQIGGRKRIQLQQGGRAPLRHD